MAKPVEPGDLLTVEEASRLLSIRPSTVRAWLTQGKLPRVKIGRCTRILREDVENLVRQGRTVASISGAPASPITAKKPNQ